MSSNPDFKVTVFFEVEYRKTVRLKEKLLLLNRKLYLMYGILLCLLTSTQSTDRLTRRAGCQHQLIIVIAVSNGSAYTVVRATHQVGGKWQFRGCQNSVTPEPID